MSFPSVLCSPSRLSIPLRLAGAGALILATLLAGCTHEEHVATPLTTATAPGTATPVATPTSTPSLAPASPLAEITTDTSQRTIAAEKDAEVFVRVRIKGLPLKLTKATPVNLTLVVDTSGSMAGAEIEKEREAVATLVEKMREGDSLAIVTFGSQPKVLLAPTKLDAKTRGKAKEAIAGMVATGTTDMAGGLSLGLSQAQSMRNGEAINRIVLIGDGVPNDPTNIPGFAAAAKQNGIPITTLGLGPDFDETLMTRIARDSGGTFHFVDSAARVAGVFDQEISRMQRVVARNAWVKVTPGPGVEIAEVIGVPAGSAGNRALSFSLGELAEGQVRDTLLRVKIRGHKEGSGVELLDVEAHFTPPAGGESVVTDFESIAASKDAGSVTEGRVAELEHQAARALVAAGIVRALELARVGDLSGARSLLDKTAKLAQTEGKRFDDAELAAKAKEIQAVKKTLASLAPAPAPVAEAGGAGDRRPAPPQPMAKPASAADAMAVRKVHGAAMSELQGM